jgi:UDP-2-acetamido-3-amino-2,3-dideoxy-glucuronate N-acetyltransferase
VIHPTAEIEEGAEVGRNTRVWHYVHIRSGAIIGDDCNLGHSVYVDSGAVIGNCVKLQNRVSVYKGVTLEDGVFVGPHATFTNDKHPRSIKPDGAIVVDEDWVPVSTLVKFGASIGANATILPGITIGRWAMVGADALVTRDVPDHALVVGTPARHVGWVCRDGRTLHRNGQAWACPHCGSTYDLPEAAEAGGRGERRRPR